VFFGAPAQRNEFNALAVERIEVGVDRQLRVKDQFLRQLSGSLLPKLNKAQDFVILLRFANVGLIFVSHGGLLNLDMDQFREGLKAEWFNPLTAERREAAARADGYFQPPSRDDWVLVLK
jgi:hypothetical protein